jgi:hypothetical protein
MYRLVLTISDGDLAESLSDSGKTIEDSDEFDKIGAIRDFGSADASSLVHVDD